jgi:CRISPR-associated protein Cmr3
MNIFIEPSDVWLFRDGRPFAPNERGRAVSLFPPTPQTIQGVLRSARLAHSGEPFDYRQWSDTLKAEIGQPDDFGALRLRGPLVARREDNDVRRFFPLPQDVTKLKVNESQEAWHVLSPRPDPNLQTNFPHGDLQPLMPSAIGEPTKFDIGWLNESGVLAYLRGTAPSNDDMVKSDALYGHEARFGVQIDSYPKRPAEGMLYQVEFVRLKEKVGLLVEVEGVNLPGSGLLQLGGEARAGRYMSVDCDWALAQEQRKQSLQQMSDGKMRFKLYLATPAIFKRGWLPEWIDAQTLTSKHNGVEVKLITAAIGKRQAIGGRDIARGDVQRSMRRAVPAGSVYFFETNADASDVFAAFDGKCVSDIDNKIGFGLCYIGGW